LNQASVGIGYDMGQIFFAFFATEWSTAANSRTIITCSIDISRGAWQDWQDKLVTNSRGCDIRTTFWLPIDVVVCICVNGVVCSGYLVV